MRKNIKNIAGCLLILAAPTGTNAQVVYHDISPDKTVNFSSYELNIGCSPDSCQLYPSQNIKLTLGAAGGWVYWQSDARILVDGQGRAVAMDLGNTISGVDTWSSNGEALLNSNSVGNWISVNNKYLAVKILKSGQWHYGWVRMDMGADGTFGVVKDYAINSLPNSPISAGQLTATGLDKVDKNQDVVVYIAGKTLKLERLKNKSLLTVYSMEGKIILKKETHSDISVDLSHLSAGVYLARVVSQSGKKDFRLLIN